MTLPTRPRHYTATYDVVYPLPLAAAFSRRRIPLCDHDRDSRFQPVKDLINWSPYCLDAMVVHQRCSCVSARIFQHEINLHILATFQGTVYGMQCPLISDSKWLLFAALRCVGKQRCRFTGSSRFVAIRVDGGGVGAESLPSNVNPLNPSANKVNSWGICPLLFRASISLVSLELQGEISRNRLSPEI